MRKCALICTLAVFSSLASTVQANHHVWNFKEVFSNWNGSVQFIEFEIPTNTDAQDEWGGRAIEATSVVAGVPTVKTFNFPAGNAGDLPHEDTSFRSFLIASPGFGSLPGGVAPDYTLPAGLMPFFNPNADTITLKIISANINVDGPLTFTGAQLPKDGKTSLTDTHTGTGAPVFVLTPNSPKNFGPLDGSGTEGHVNLPVPEPSSLVLAAMAAMAIAGKAFRRANR